MYHDVSLDKKCEPLKMQGQLITPEWQRSRRGSLRPKRGVLTLAVRQARRAGRSPNLRSLNRS